MFFCEFNKELDKIVLNERVVVVFGLINFIGKVISWKGNDKEVIGICYDFYGQFFYEVIKLMVILFDFEEMNMVLVRI